MPKVLQLSILWILALLLAPHASVAQVRTVPESRAEAMLSYAPLVKKSAPAVVNIYTSKKVKVRTSPLLMDPFFKQFFGEGGPFASGPIREKMVNSLGSGVIVSADGLVITNNHVISGSDEIRVLLSDKREYEARLMLADARADLAVLKITAQGEHFPFLELGDSDSLEVGDMVLAIGNPFGVGQTVTSGIVSALARTTQGISDYQFFIQTDAAINPGNSGGALVDMQGKLIGINTAIFSKTGASNGIGFATPANMARTVLSGVSKGKRVIRPWLGASVQTVTQKIATALGMKTPQGVIVKNVEPDGPAAKAGLEVNDIILEVDGKEVADEQGLRYRIATFEVGSSIPFKFMRKDKLYMAQVVMQPPVENPPRQLTLLTGEHILAGVQVANLSPALADELKLPEYHGVVITEIRSSPAIRLGLKPGDIIVSVGKEKIQSVDALVEALSSPNGGTLTFAIRRGDNLLTFRVAL
jgi:Do/DeqQ family serine protease